MGTAVLINCVQAVFGFLSFVPAALCGTAIYFGTTFVEGAPWWHSLLAVIVGPIMGYIAEWVGFAIAKKS
jgi:hypothetical protein